MQKIDATWAALNMYLAGLSEGQMSGPRDSAGWKVKDHLAHLAVWEQSIVMLFQGQPRYQTLGVDAALYEMEKLHEINAAIYLIWEPVALAEVMERFGSVHAQMVTLVQGLSDAELNQTMDERFPQLSQGDERKLAYVILGNTEYHFLEHLPWIRAIVEQ